MQDQKNGKLPAIPQEAIDAKLDAYLRAANVVEAINANLPRGVAALPPIPKDYVFKRFDREVTTLAMHTAFELAGGVPNLVRWANSDPKAFFNIWSKLIPTEQVGTAGGAAVQINISSAVERSPLDLQDIDAQGRPFIRDDE